MTRYYVNDRLSERLTLDSSGNVVGRQAHLPFGEDFAESGTQDKRHFTSYERDGAAGLDYAVNRSYVPGVGRFNSADPYEESGSQFGPQSWNRYAYVENDPIHNVDPQGLNLKAPNPESPDPCGTPSGGSGDCAESYCPPTGEIPKPKPAPPTTCQIRTLTFGPREGRYKFPAGASRSPNLEPGWNHGAHISSDGFWTFFFEVEVRFAGGRFRRGDWLFEQWASASWEQVVALSTGTERTLSGSRFNPNDMAYPENTYTEEKRFLWLDTPGLAIFGGGGSLVEGSYTWSLSLRPKQKNR